MAEHTSETRRERAAVDEGHAAGQSLRPECAFVVQLRGPASRNRLQGRVEHVVSGETLRFGSAAELIEFLSRRSLP